MNALEIKELPFSSKAQICWGFFWRGIAITIGSALVGAVIGGIAGVVLALVSAPKISLAVASGGLGAITGAFFLYLYVRWLLTTRLGKFRLVLIHAREQI